MVTRYGQPPVMRYEVNDGGWRASVMLDDVGGNIVVEFDTRKFFGHWWSIKTNKCNSLRAALITFNQGYIEDKFSYGLDRWDGEKAVKELHKLCMDKWGHEESWPLETYEAWEAMDDGISEAAFYAILNYTEHFNEVYTPGEHSFGGIYANKHVTNFVKRMWPQLVEHWKKELEAENGDAGRVSDRA